MKASDVITCEKCGADSHSKTGGWYRDENGVLLCSHCRAVKLERYIETHSPVHDWFGLSYAGYLVLPRALMQEMTEPWQKKMVELLEEFEQTWKYDDNYSVQLRDEKGRYKKDLLLMYRHPAEELLERIKRKREK